MKRKMPVLASVVALTMALTACGGASGTKESSSPAASAPAASAGASTAKDTITALLPPVSPNYQKLSNK